MLKCIGSPWTSKCGSTTFSTKTEKWPRNLKAPAKSSKSTKKANGKPIRRNILHLKPYFAPSIPTPIFSWAKIAREGEGLDNDSNEDPHTNWAYAVNLMFSKEASKHKSINNQKLINSMNDAKELKEIRPYLLDHALKILTNQDLEVDPLTSQERTDWNKFSTWERSVILTGSPLGIPEWRHHQFHQHRTPIYLRHQ